MNDATNTAEAPAKTSKSIVPAKYAGKYKDGGSDALAVFLKEQCITKEGFSYPLFFKLCRINGIPEDKVAMYEGQVEAKKLGSQGRARMTLRNMLATLVRKDGTIKDLDGDLVEVELPKTVLTGAAAAAKAKQEAANEPTAERKF
jgi:hypothetical protein